MKTVAIVGGGYGGIALAKALESHFQVYLIDRKDYFLHNVGAMRASVVPGFVDNIVLPYTDLLRKGTFIQAEVTSITGTAIKVAGRDQAVTFDYVVIATGSMFAFPCQIQATNGPQARREYAQAVDDLGRAGRRVVVVGGGPVSCEFAGEIKAQHPDKEVTIISKLPRLCQSNKPEKFISNLERCVQQQGIQVKTNVVAYIDDWNGTSVIKGPTNVRLSNGEQFEADLVFVCIGVTKMNNSSYAKEFALDDKGRLKVNEFFQVEGQNNVFAIGDCIQADEDRLAAYAGNHASLLAKNLIALQNGNAMKPYKPAGYSTMIVPVGPKTGVSLLFGFNLGAFVTKMAKSKDLFTSRYAAILNVRLPATNAKFQSVARKHTEPDPIVDKLAPASH